jgi:hypothetical protein
MKRTAIYFSLIGAMVLSSTGCTEFLDTVPDNRTEIDDVEKTYKLLANAYPRNTYAGILEARCDGMTDFGNTFYGGQQTESYEFMKAGFYWEPYVQSSADDTYAAFWEDCYKMVSYANFALQSIEKYKDEWSEADVKRLRAEAKVCRAYAHFMLVSLYSNMFQYHRQGQNPGIPYVTEPEDTLLKQYDRETVAVTLTKVADDLFSEIDNLGGPSSHDVPEFRFTRNAALAFAVRYCLFTQDYRGVIKYANALLGTASTHEVMTGAGSQNFDGSQKQYVMENDGAFRDIRAKMLDWGEYSRSGTDLYQPGKYFTNPKNPSYLLTSEVESIVMRTFIGTLFTNYSYNQQTVSDIGSAPIFGTNRRWALPQLQLTGDETVFWVKYYEDMLLVNESAGIGYVYLKANLFRLEEVLLARAEAKAILSDFDGAIDDINMYVANKLLNYNYAADRLDRDRINTHYRPTIGGSGEDVWINNEFNSTFFDSRGYETVFELPLVKTLLLCVMDLRRVEFMFEGMRYFDILRWNIPVTHTRTRDNMSRTMQPDDDMRVLQLPQTTALSGLKPNPMEHNQGAWPGIIYNY